MKEGQGIVSRSDHLLLHIVGSGTVSQHAPSSLPHHWQEQPVPREDGGGDKARLQHLPLSLPGAFLQCWTPRRSDLCPNYPVLYSVLSQQPFLWICLCSTMIGPPAHFPLIRERSCPLLSICEDHLPLLTVCSAHPGVCSRSSLISSRLRPSSGCPMVGDAWYLLQSPAISRQGDALTCSSPPARRSVSRADTSMSC